MKNKLENACYTFDRLVKSGSVFNNIKKIVGILQPVGGIFVGG